MIPQVLPSKGFETETENCVPSSLRISSSVSSGKWPSWIYHTRISDSQVNGQHSPLSWPVAVADTDYIDDDGDRWEMPPLPLETLVQTYEVLEIGENLQKIGENAKSIWLTRDAKSQNRLKYLLERQTPTVLALWRRLNVVAAAVGREWKNPDSFPNTKALAPLFRIALDVHKIKIDDLTKWFLRLDCENLDGILWKPKPWGVLDEIHREQFCRMVALFRDSESMSLLKSIREYNSATYSTLLESPGPSKIEEENSPISVDPAENDVCENIKIEDNRHGAADGLAHACRLCVAMDKKGAEVTNEGKSKPQTKSKASISSAKTDKEEESDRWTERESHWTHDDDGNSVQLQDMPKTSKHPIAEPVFPAEQLTLTKVGVKFETLMAGILRSPNLRLLKMESVEIETSSGVFMSEIELFDAFKQLVAFSTLGSLALSRLFTLPPLELQIGDVSSPTGQMLLFCSGRESMVASLPGISKTLEMISKLSLGFALSSLALRDVTLEDSKGLRNVFGKLESLSLKNVLFWRKDDTTPEMPPSLLKSLTQLVKFRVEETKGLHPSSFMDMDPTPHFPKTVKHLALLTYASWYFKPPTHGVEFDYVHVTRMPLSGDVPTNTKYLSVNSLNLLNSAVTADILKPSPLRRIWVNRGNLWGKDTGQSSVAVSLLLKQLGIPMSEEKFVLVRDTALKPWREEDVWEDDGANAENFLNEFASSLTY